jgi:hypothetical protein
MQLFWREPLWLAAMEVGLMFVNENNDFSCFSQRTMFHYVMEEDFRSDRCSRVLVSQHGGVAGLLA